MLFKSLCCEIIMEHKESTSVKIMAISAEVLLTKKRVSLTIPVLKNGINTHPWKVMCVTLCLSGLLVLSLLSQSFRHYKGLLPNQNQT